MFKHWLVKEPLIQNSFKLVYSVSRYAIKHKHPECRSAFTYCEDKSPSRIDLVRVNMEDHSHRAGGRCQNISTVYNCHADGNNVIWCDVCSKSAYAYVDQCQ